jgi:inorganic pyrophosphatase
MSNLFTVDVVVEIPNGSNLKYEIDNNGNVRLDRVLSCSMTYPGNYGFIPKTLAKDGDPLDILILVPYALHPGSIVKCRILGTLVMSDEKGLDEKVLVIPIDQVDPNYKSWLELKDIPQIQLEKIKHFFEHYKKTDKNKWTEVKDFLNRDESEKLVQLYTKEYENANKVK